MVHRRTESNARRLAKIEAALEALQARRTTAGRPDAATAIMLGTLHWIVDPWLRARADNPKASPAALLARWLWPAASRPMDVLRRALDDPDDTSLADALSAKADDLAAAFDAHDPAAVREVEPRPGLPTYAEFRYHLDQQAGA